MKNRIKSGDTLTLTAPSGGVISGGFYKIGQLLVVAVATVAQGLPFEGAVTGEYASAPKATGQAWTEGALVYWSTANSNFTTTSTSNLLAGVATVAAASGDTTGTVRLQGIAAVNS